MSTYTVLTDSVIKSIKSIDASWKQNAAKTRANMQAIVLELDTLKGEVFTEIKHACKENGLTHLRPADLRAGLYSVMLMNRLVNGEIEIDVVGKYKANDMKIDESAALKATISKMASETFYKSSMAELVKFTAKSLDTIVKAMNEGVKQSAKAELVYDLDEDGKKLEFPSKLLVTIQEPIGKTISKEDKADNAAAAFLKLMDDCTEDRLVEVAKAIKTKYPELDNRAQDELLDEAETK